MRGVCTQSSQRVRAVSKSVSEATQEEKRLEHGVVGPKRTGLGAALPFVGDLMNTIPGKPFLMGSHQCHPHNPTENHSQIMKEWTPLGVTGHGPDGTAAPHVCISGGGGRAQHRPGATTAPRGPGRAHLSAPPSELQLPSCTATAPLPSPPPSRRDAPWES